MTTEEIETRLAKMEQDIRTLAEALLQVGETLAGNQKTITFILEQLNQQKVDESEAK